MLISPILNTNSYKLSHYMQYPEDATHVSSYIESRKGADDGLVFFGLQYYLIHHLLNPVGQDDIDHAEDLLSCHGLPFNRDGWEYIAEHHDGFLPLEISAVPEGSVVPSGNALVQVVNTDPKLPWLPGYVETGLLRAVWYGSTVATISLRCKRIINSYLKMTADNTDKLPFMLHDFGARGVSSFESSAIGGAAHLVNFKGTDNVPALLMADAIYQDAAAGVSIPAAEHSTITAWGRAGEIDAYKNILDQFLKPGSTVAVVSDSYNLWHAIDVLWGQELKDQIVNSGGTLVIRPDSGDPISVVPDTIDRLMRLFGSYQNQKGYRELPPYIRVIQGDGISVEAIGSILEAMRRRKQSAENIAFGMGGELLQKVNRDTFGFAMKASAIKRQGVWHDAYKQPITDPGKTSKKGRFALINENGSWRTIPRTDIGGRRDYLEPVYLDGDVLRHDALADIAERCACGD